MKQHWAAGLELVLIHDGQYTDVHLRSNGAGDDGMGIVNDLLEIADDEWRAADFIHLVALLLHLLLVGLQSLLVVDKLLLQDEKVLDARQLEAPESASCMGGD